jgi:hypothetical protein
MSSFIIVILPNDNSVSRKVYNDQNKADLPNVKEIWKWCCGASLGRRLGVSFDMKVLCSRV